MYLKSKLLKLKYTAHFYSKNAHRTYSEPIQHIKRFFFSFLAVCLHFCFKLFEHFLIYFDTVATIGYINEHNSQMLKFLMCYSVVMFDMQQLHGIEESLKQ